MGPRVATEGGTRERIVDTALRLFSERGTAAVSVRELADAAGVTVPGLYYHFASKAELIREVYRSQGLARPLEDFEPPSATTLEARVVERARTEFAGLVENAEFLRHMQRESVLGDEDAREAGEVLAAQWRERWHLVLTGARDVAPDADLDAAADVIATFLWGLFVEYLNRLDPSVIERVEPFAALIAPALTGTAP
jgi:TetR/AcrR family transcriptional repressor of uid operon